MIDKTTQEGLVDCNRVRLTVLPSVQKGSGGEQVI